MKSHSPGPGPGLIPVPGPGPDPIPVPVPGPGPGGFRLVGCCVLRHTTLAADAPPPLSDTTLLPHPGLRYEGKGAESRISCSLFLCSSFKFKQTLLTQVLLRRQSETTQHDHSHTEESETVNGEQSCRLFITIEPEA